MSVTLEQAFYAAVERWVGVLDDQAKRVAVGAAVYSEEQMATYQKVVFKMPAQFGTGLASSARWGWLTFRHRSPILSIVGMFGLALIGANVIIQLLRYLIAA